MRRMRTEEPALITDAALSAEAEHEQRRRRYGLMMGLRGLCVVGACLAYPLSVALSLALVAGGVVLPWCAVVLANGGPPKRRSRAQPHLSPTVERGLTSGEDGRTVDG